MGDVAPLVSLTGVSYSYPLPGGGRQSALRDVTLAVRPGERLVVLGANGAGKSTLAALLAGVLQPTSGEVSRAPGDGGGAAVLPAGLVTQNPEDTFSCPLVREEMGVVLENLDREPAAIDTAVAAMLAAVGLTGHADSHPSLLSGGQKQLLAVSSILIADPPLLVLDEPLTLLDSRARAEVEGLLARSGTEGAAAVFLSCEVEDAARGERVLLLHRGAIVWEGAPADLPADEEWLAAWGLLPPAGTPLVASRVAGAAGSPQQPSIAITDLHFSYDPGTAWERPVLRGLDLEARPGEVLGVIGAIGSGKTTLIQHLNGLFLPQRGEVRVGDRVLRPGAKLDRLLYREVGVVFQFPEKQLFAETVSEDVAAGLEFAGVAREEIPPRVHAVLERVGLDAQEDGSRSPFTLAWGEKRLAALAGVLVLDTPRIVLDEPGAGLDPAGRRRLGAILGDLAHREGKTVVVVSHHLADLFRTADRVAVLHEGRIVFCGTPADIVASGDLARWGLL